MVIPGETATAAGNVNERRRGSDDKRRLDDAMRDRRSGCARAVRVMTNNVGNQTGNYARYEKFGAVGLEKPTSRKPELGTLSCHYTPIDILTEFNHPPSPPARQVLASQKSKSTSYIIPVSELLHSRLLHNLDSY